MSEYHEEAESKCAVRLPGRSFDLGPVDVYLRANGISDARRFAAKDDDELNDAVCAGDIRRVVFTGVEELLEAIWIGHVRYSRWMELGVQVDVVHPPQGGWKEWAMVTAGSFERYRRGLRVRQIVAATVLSLLALGGIAAVLWLR